MNRDFTAKDDQIIKNSALSVWLEQRVRWTGDVIGLMGAVILIAAAVITLGILARLFTLQDTLPIFILLILIVPAWLAVRRGRWKWAGYLPVLLCFSLGVYSSLLFRVYHHIRHLLRSGRITGRHADQQPDGILGGAG